MSEKSFGDLTGARITKVTGLEEGSECVTFETDKGELALYHSQACCESVQLQELDGGAEELEGQVVLYARVEEGDLPYRGSSEEPELYLAESYTWTFLRIGTIKGTVVMRWLGESNGYYGETPAIAWDGDRSWEGIVHE